MPGEISRIYVIESFHGSGLGKLFLDHQIEIAKETQCTGVWLSVWEKNVRAQKFYLKNGFTPVGEQIFVVGNDPQKDLILCKQL
jgi:ribosomal protein S18 acetylase RimI-like enzyme